MILYSKCDWESYLWQQLELASVDWGMKWLFDFNAGKTQLISFDWSNSTGAIDVITLVLLSVPGEKSSSKILGLSEKILY